MISVVDLDLFKANVDVIAHQVNCMGVMGSGVAAQVRTKYPDAYSRYRAVCREFRPQDLLGTTQVVAIKDCDTLMNGRPFVVANLFSQLSYGRGKQHTNYKALASCLRALACEMRYRGYHSVAVPYLMGCVRGGGDWNSVRYYLEKELDSFDVIICRKDKC